MLGEKSLFLWEAELALYLLLVYSLCQTKASQRCKKDVVDKCCHLTGHILAHQDKTMLNL